jgi:hypothetical protein
MSFVFSLPVFIHDRRCDLTNTTMLGEGDWFMSCLKVMYELQRFFVVHFDVQNITFIPIQFSYILGHEFNLRSDSFCEFVY